MSELAKTLDGLRRSIYTESYSMSIGELSSMYERGELDIHPDFQRLYRWTKRQKVNFVESVLLHIPLPGIYVAQRPDAVWDVIDGLQRLSTIFEFMGLLKDVNDKLVEPLILEGTDFLPELQDLWFSEEGKHSLDKIQQLDFRRQKIDVKIILSESTQDAKFDLFTRLNTGGTPLSPQEVRIAITLMKNSSFFPFTQLLEENEDFRYLTCLTPQEKEIRTDNELILRWLMLSNATEVQLSEIRNDEDALSNRRLLEFLAKEDLEFDREQRLFERVFARLAKALPEAAFRDAPERGEGATRLNLFDGIAIAAAFAGELDEGRVKAAFDALCAAREPLSVAERVASGRRALDGAP